MKKFFDWLKGKNTAEFLENVSFVTLVFATLLVMVGIGLGSFVSGMVFLGAFGAFLILAGIIIYIASQFVERK